MPKIGDLLTNKSAGASMEYSMSVMRAKKSIRTEENGKMHGTENSHSVVKAIIANPKLWGFMQSGNSS